MRVVHSTVQQGGISQTIDDNGPDGRIPKRQKIESVSTLHMTEVDEYLTEVDEYLTKSTNN
jgi:hypothetical protein